LISRRIATHAWAMVLAVAPLVWELASAAEPTERPRDAAEAVKEGDVAQWLKYYQRDRAQQPQSLPVAQGGDAPPADPAAPNEADAKR